jgi:segregation and condensation protein B
MGEMNLTAGSQEELDNSEERKNLKKIEAALFVSARYLSIEELVELTNINPLLLRELLEKLKEDYHSRDCSIEIINKSELWKMDLKQEYFNMINKLASGNAEFTKAEQETLAIIAYKQPVKQSVLIKIRGNKAYEHVAHFMELGLVRARKFGHTIELNLTEQFYDYFHLEKKVNSSKVKDNQEELELKEIV